MDLQKWARRIHKNAVAKGFWARRIRKNAVANGFWDVCDHPRFLASQIARAHAELSEVFELVRRPDRACEPSDACEGHVTRIEEELADVMICLLDICGRYDYDLDLAVRLKHHYNTGRDRNHGKVF